jgi:transposase-like protein
MRRYSEDAWERTMEVQDVILRAIAKRITWWHTAEIIGISDRSMRRWRERYDEYESDGPLDRRRVKPARAPVQMDILTCQNQSRETPGLVNNRSQMLLQLCATLSFFLTLLPMMKGGIPRAGICLCRNRAES